MSAAKQQNTRAGWLIVSIFSFIDLFIILIMFLFIFFSPKFSFRHLKPMVNYV